MSRLLIGDCRDSMRRLIAEGVKVQMCVTSPPYWGLRDYGVEGQLGLEPTIPEFVANMVEVFGLVRELLADDGTLWMNLGDSYSSQGGPGWQGKNGQRADRRFTAVRDSTAMREMGRTVPDGLKPKDMCGIPWRVAFALQSAGWWLRQDIIWHKPNPMPESIKDRCTKAHEYLFLMAKSERYLCDMDAIAEPVTLSTIERMSQPNLENQEGSDRVPGKTSGNMHAVLKKSGNKERKDRHDYGGNPAHPSGQAFGVPWEENARATSDPGETTYPKGGERSTWGRSRFTRPPARPAGRNRAARLPAWSRARSADRRR